MVTLNELNSVTVFRAVKDNPLISAYSAIPASENLSADEKLAACCNFVSVLFASGESSLSSAVGGILNDDENIYIKHGAAGEMAECIASAANRELEIFSRLASTTADELRAFCGSDAVPSYPVGDTDIAANYTERVNNTSKYGYGIYSRYYMFTLTDDGAIVPVRRPDPVTLTELIGYEREKKLIIDNTLALLSGKPAANMLLTGDAGTGKSSTVKAVVNEYHAEGIRILEVRKEQLFMLPAVLSELNENPLKFIVFIDDLSFAKDDDNFGALKAILEGSVTARAENVVIYATSNRRHLVKETFSDREGDDIHRNDTMQEIISLSDRFGIQVTFSRPDKFTYLNIVHSLAKLYGVTMDENELDAEAERYILGRGSRSARAAKQFIDILRSKQ